MTNQKAKFEHYLRKNHLCSWLATKYHHTHKNKPISFHNREFQKKIYLENADYIVIKKSTQCGCSEWLICNSFSKALTGRSVFYVLPTFALTTRFVRNRIDRTCQYSRYYKVVIQEGIKSQSESIMLKHFGSGSIAFVGSNTAGVFTEYPADDLIIDELDYCDQDNIEMGWERLSEAEHKMEIRISNPTIEGFGIDTEYATTTQYEWHIKCECGNYVKPDFFEHVVRETGEGQFVIRDKDYKRDGMDINLICDRCDKPVDRKAGGLWIPRYPGRAKKGYHISKLFSTNVKVREIVDRFEKGLSSDIVMQRFYNADLGIAYTAKGAKLTDDMLDDCKEDYQMRAPKKGAICLMGVDVGKLLHVRISQLLPDKRMKAVFIGEVRDEQDIVDLYTIYQVKLGIIDAMPESRMSKSIASKLKNMFICYYGQGKKDSIDIHNKIITVDRTAALDNVKESVVLKNIILPKNAQSIPNYYPQMVASTRVWDEKRQRYIWIEGSKEDHFFHAEAYGILARKLLVMLYNR